MTRLLEDVARATSLREGPEGVANVLRLVYAAGKINLRDLARRAGLPLPVLAAVRRELERAQILDRRAGLVLTPQGRLWVEHRLDVKTRHDATCPTCGGRRILVADELRPVLDKLEHYRGQNPAVDVTLDQAPCLAETSLRRALFMYQAGALEGKSVLILGDDDSVSLAAALLPQALGRKNLARRLTVVEIDEDRMHHIRRVCQEEDLDVEGILCDLRDPLPEDLAAQFDSFQTDPPYTAAGLTLFASRAIKALKPGVGQQGFLSYGPKSAAELLEAQSSLARMGLAVREILPSFNDYEGASLLGGQSQLIHLLTTPATRPVVADGRYQGPIYTGESSPTHRLYRCLQCKTDWRVGQGETFSTIEALKAATCPHCGHPRFRYLRRIAPAGPGVPRRQ